MCFFPHTAYANPASDLWARLTGCEVTWCPGSKTVGVRISRPLTRHPVSTDRSASSCHRHDRIRSVFINSPPPRRTELSLSKYGAVWHPRSRSSISETSVCERQLGHGFCQVDHIRLPAPCRHIRAFDHLLWSLKIVQRTRKTGPGKMRPGARKSSHH